MQFFCLKVSNGNSAKVKRRLLNSLKLHYKFKRLAGVHQKFNGGFVLAELFDTARIINNNANLVILICNIDSSYDGNNRQANK